MIKTRLKALKNRINDEGIDYYYLNTSDDHLSEYVPEYYRTIAYFSGFTGSAASLIVGREEAWIFVDGRYHVQADRECLPNGVRVVKLGSKDAPDPIAFLAEKGKDAVVALDGTRTSIRFAKKIARNNTLISRDLYSDLIKDRSPLCEDPVRELEERYTGLSRKKKIEMIRYCLEDKVHIVGNLESIAYLLNLRGNDVIYTPVFRAFMVFYEREVYLFCDLKRFSPEILEKLYDDGVILRPYDSYYPFLKGIKGKQIVLDENKVNYQTWLDLDRRHNRLYDMPSLIEKMKAVKNPVEQRNFIQAHIYDAVAVLRFLMWLDSIDRSTVSEYDAKNKIDSLRLEYRAMDLSFSSIVAYNENAALMHYAPTKEKCSMLDNKGILLFDTGGHYPEGTTDITRTVALGEVDDEVKKYFTLVLRSMFNLSEAKFLKGMSGKQLDILARKDLWAEGIDYRCGTGHGVGYVLSVHEGPPNIRWGSTDAKTEEVPLVPGMIVSDEPGVYIEGKFGIRCENLILCEKDIENEYGQFLRFRTLTLVPFDLRLIDRRYLDDKTVSIINTYHRRIYDTLLPYLNAEEAQYLRKVTREI